MKKQTFQHAELRDEHNEIIQEGTYGKYSDFSNEQNNGFIDYVMNNLEWLRKHFDGYAKISDVEKDFLKKTDTPKIDLTGLASTEYVDGRIKHVVGTAPEALDTLGEIATALTTNKDKIGTIINQISTKADKGTVENALMGKADKNKVEKALTDKANKNNVYTKEEIDEKLKNIPKVDASEFVKMRDGHIVLGDYEIWIEE